MPKDKNTVPIVTLEDPKKEDVKDVKDVGDVKVLTPDEIDAIIADNVKLKQATSGLDKKVSELLNEKKAINELEEIRKKEAMTAQEKTDYEMKERLKVIDDYEKKILVSNFKEYANEKLTESGLSSSYIDLIMGESNAEIELKVKKLKDNLEKEVINKQKDKVITNSYTPTGKQGIDGDLDKVTLMRKEIDNLLENGNNSEAVRKQFLLKQIQREKMLKK